MTVILRRIYICTEKFLNSIHFLAIPLFFFLIQELVGTAMEIFVLSSKCHKHDHKTSKESSHGYSFTLLRFPFFNNLVCNIQNLHLGIRFCTFYSKLYPKSIIAFHLCMVFKIHVRQGKTIFVSHKTYKILNFTINYDVSSLHVEHILFCFFFFLELTNFITFIYTCD